MLLNKQSLNEVSFVENPQLSKSVSIDSDGIMSIKGIILSKADEKNKNNRIYPKTILEREINKLMPKVQSRMLRGELDHPSCLTSGNILTKDGWKDLKDITDDELIYTLNLDTNQIELQKIDKKIDEPYAGKMYHIKGNNIDITATPNHRFVVQDRKGKFKFITAQEIFELSEKGKSTHLTIPKTGKWDGNFDDEFFEIGSLRLNSKAFFAFLGFYLAEGHCRGNSVYIDQNEGKKAEKFRGILRSMSDELIWQEGIRKTRKNVSIGFRVSNSDLNEYLGKLGNKYTKFIPQEIKNASVPLLEELFAWFVKGDGTIVKNKNCGVDNFKTSVFSVSKNLIDDLNEILLKIGRSGRIRIQNSKKDYVFADHLIETKNKKPLYRLYVNSSDSIHLDFRWLTITEEDYDGNVYCVQVPNQTFYCENEGKCFWSGNSRLDVLLKESSHLVTGAYWDSTHPNWLLGDLEILKNPLGNLIEVYIKQRSPVGISSRGEGSLLYKEDYYEVQDDFDLVTYDVVADQSTFGAIINESLRSGVLKLNKVTDPILEKYYKEFEENQQMLYEQIRRIVK